MRRGGKRRRALFWCFEARRDASQESRPRCVVVVYQRSDRGGLLERTSHRFIAVAAANHGRPVPRRLARNPTILWCVSLMKEETRGP